MKEEDEKSPQYIKQNSQGPVRKSSTDQQMKLCFQTKEKVNKGKVTSAKSEDGVDLEKEIKTCSKGFLPS